MESTDLDDAVQVLHDSPVEKYGVAVVSSKTCRRHLHLALLERQLDHGVHQDLVLLFMQTKRSEQQHRMTIF